jgi:hypothetical protein
VQSLLKKRQKSCQELQNTKPVAIKERKQHACLQLEKKIIPYHACRSTPPNNNNNNNKHLITKQASMIHANQFKYNNENIREMYRRNMCS